MMINELPQTYEGIAETFFENPDDRSQFRKVMLNNMKESTGVDPDITNEAIAETLNEDRDEDLYQGIEKGLMINPSDPETRKNMLSNMEVIGKLSRVYPNTAIEELFSEDYLSRKIATDDVFLINATNTNTDYPVYITRWNLFATRLLDRLNQDDPSLWSIAKRAVTPMLLGAIESVGKKAVGKTFLAHGLTAAYDVSQLGNSIYNTQRDFNKRLRDIMDNKNLDSEQYVQEIEGLLDDVQKVPEEYRYEIYNSLWRGPDLYADSGLSFTSFGFTGIVHGMSSLKANITRYLPSFSSQNVKHLVLNDELGQKIVDLATNSSNEEKAIEKVTAKVTENQPKDAPESEVAVAKGIAINEDTDKNLRLNSNKDGGFFDILARALSSIGGKSDQRGEIRLTRPEQVVVTRVGKGVDNEPMNWEEVQDWLKREQGPSAGVFRYDQTAPHSIEFDPDNAKSYIQIQTASPDAWSTDPNVPGIFDYEGHHPGENSQAFGGGGYAGVPSSGWSSAEGRYFRQFDRQKTSHYPQELVKFNGGFVTDVIGLRQTLLGTPKDNFFNNNNKYYKRALEMIDPDGEIESKVPGYNRTYFTDGITDIGRYIKAFENDEDMMKALNIVFNTKESRSIFANGVLINTHSFRDYDTNPIQVINAVLYNKKDRHFIDEYIKNYEDELNRNVNELKTIYKKYEDLKIKYKATDADMQRFSDRLNKRLETGSKTPLSKNVEDKLIAAENTLFGLTTRTADVMFSQSKLDQLKEIAPKLKTFLEEGFTVEKEHPLNYKTTLNTHIIQNPEKRLDNLLWWDEKYGIQPLAFFYKGDKAKAAEDIMYEKISSINKDIAKGIYNAVQNTDGSVTVPHAINKNYVFYPGLSLDKTEKAVAKLYSDMNLHNSDSLGAWEDLMRRYVYNPLSDSEKDKYHDFKDWQSKYLTEKGIDITWHHGNPTSPGNNVVVHNTKMFQPVTKVETDILDPNERTQYLYHNGHGYESAGDGVGFYGLVVHTPEGSKPIIAKGGKVVDKGDYKEYNPKK